MNFGSLDRRCHSAGEGLDPFWNNNALTHDEDELEERMAWAKKWSEEEEDIIRRRFRRGDGAADCYRLLKGKRSNSAIFGKAYNMGLIGCRMSRTNILLKMHEKPSSSLFTTRSLGGNLELLDAMAKNGLISAKSTGWFLSKNQRAAVGILLGE